MPPSNPAEARPHWTSGRCFSSADPERQREVVGYVRRHDAEVAGASRAAAQPSARPAPSGWARATPETEGSFEGGSSGRWR